RRRWATLLRECRLGLPGCRPLKLKLLAHDQHRRVTVSENLRRLAAEQQATDPAPPMRCHYDQVAAATGGGFQDCGCRLRIRNLKRLRLYAFFGRELLRCRKDRAGELALSFIVTLIVGLAGHPS